MSVFLLDQTTNLESGSQLVTKCRSLQKRLLQSKCNNMSPTAQSPALQRLKASSHSVYAMTALSRLLLSHRKAASTPTPQQLLEENAALRAETERLKLRRAKDEGLTKTVRRLSEQIERQRISLDLQCERAARDHQELEETAKQLLVRQKAALDDKRDRELGTLLQRLAAVEAEAEILRETSEAQRLAKDEQQQVVIALKSELKQVEDSLLEASEWDVARGRELRRRIALLDQEILDLHAAKDSASRREQAAFAQQIEALETEKRAQLLQAGAGPDLHAENERLQQELDATKRHAAADLKNLAGSKDAQMRVVMSEVLALQEQLRCIENEEAARANAAEEQAASWYRMATSQKVDAPSQGKCYKKVVELAPDANDARYWHSLGFMGGGTVSGTEHSQIECYQSSLALEGSNSACWNHLGVAGGGVVLGELYTQAQCYQKALEHDESNRWAWNNLGYLGGGKVKGREVSKIECYQKCVELDGTDVRAWRKLGIEGGGYVHGQHMSQAECYARSKKSSIKQTRHGLSPMIEEFGE